jgi:hypothetical protein
MTIITAVFSTSVKWDRCLMVFRAFRAVKDQSLTTLNTSHFTDVPGIHSDSTQFSWVLLESCEPSKIRNSQEESRVRTYCISLDENTLDFT